MKKFLLLTAVIFLLTGCQNNLTCTIKTNTYNSKVTISYKDNKPKNYKQIEKIYFAKQDTKNIYYNLKTNEYQNLIKEKHTKIKKKRKSITIKTTYNFLKNNSTQENKLLINKQDTRKQAYQKIKNLGYTCK